MHQTLIFAAGSGLSTTAIRLSASHLRDPKERTLNRLAIGLALSLCLHLLFLTFMPTRTVGETPPAHVTQGPLVVQLSPPVKSSPPVAAEEAPPQQAIRPRTTTQAPRVIAVPSPLPQSVPLVPLQPAPVRPQEPAPTDFMSMVNAKREQRAAAEAAARAQRLANGREPTGDEIANANISRNFQTLTQSAGTSGIFQILNIGHRAAQFSFRGWTDDSSNSRREIIDVDAGLNGNVRLAVVRRMIALIRSHYQGNFNWDSHRLGRVVVLSARTEDTAGLEEFMMREFFQ